MKIIGANICVRPTGKRIRDAGVCLLEDGAPIVAIAEERITRKKHDWSLSNSFSYCLDAADCRPEDIDMYVFSICGTKTPNVDFVYKCLLSDGINIEKSKIVICPSHHLSHAASAFFASGFDDSIILVADRDGSILDGSERTVFPNSVEHVSCYIGRGNEIRLIDRDESFHGDIGLGLGYSYVTEWLGFEGHSMAGKTMALASYGEKGAFGSAHFFVYSNGRIQCTLEPIDSNKSLAVRRLIHKKTGIDIGAHCRDYGSKKAFDIARLVQDDLEQVLIKKLRYLREKNGMKNLCFAGGVALNCRLNYKIHKAGIFDNFFIQPAAGDTGQCLGNALYGYHIVSGQHGKYKMKHAYLGKKYSRTEIGEAISIYSGKIEVERPSNLYEHIAEKLFQGKIVAWFQGRSEFGPRALGARSILASPALPEMREKLNKEIKFREWFRPFGVIVLKEYSGEFFDFEQESPFMLIAPQVRKNVRDRIPSAVHVDSSCRIQTVDAQTNGNLHQLLTAFYAKAGIPVLINTSFNIQGEPIVETPLDALKCFLHSSMTCLVMEDYVITKK